MGILKTFIEKLETSGAVVPSGSDEPEPMPGALAAAEAAIQEAIRQRQATDSAMAGLDRRDPFVIDRRSGSFGGTDGVDRRGPVGDRRSKGPAFGRRTRD